MSFTNSAPSPLIYSHDLACERDSRVLYCGLNMKVCSGELWHIKGRNGAGKTTFLRQVAGLHSVDDGKLSIQNHLKTIYVGHKLGLKEQLSADENLEWLVGLDGASSQAQRYAALEKVGLRGYEENLVSQLSAGQKRRVALARLHLSKADVWLLDEPFTSLDQQGIKDEEQWLLKHTQEGGVILMTSHQDIGLDKVKTLDLSAYEKQPSKITCVNDEGQI